VKLEIPQGILKILLLITPMHETHLFSKRTIEEFKIGSMNSFELLEADIREIKNKFKEGIETVLSKMTNTERRKGSSYRVVQILENGQEVK
jgi:hypothetical protein